MLLLVQISSVAIKQTINLFGSFFQKVNISYQNFLFAISKCFANLSLLIHLLFTICFNYFPNALVSTTALRFAPLDVLLLDSLL